MITTSFTRTLRLSEFHFFLGTNSGNTSLVQRFQNESKFFWINSTLFLGFFVSRKAPFGNSEDERPNNISFGHRYAPSSGSLVGLPMGRWFTRFATLSKQLGVQLEWGQRVHRLLSLVPACNSSLTLLLFQSGRALLGDKRPLYAFINAILFQYFLISSLNHFLQVR